MFKKISGLAAAAVLAATAAFGASAMEKDTLIVSTSPFYPPYEFINEKGEIDGFDFDMMAAIGEKIGKKMEWQSMPFDSLIPALMSGKIDLIAAGLSATEERSKRVNFSAPYEVSVSAFLTLPDNPPKSLEDMAGKSIAVQTGTVEETYARTLNNVEVKTYQKFDDCVREVVYGRVDATFMDVPAAKAYAEAKDFAGKIVVAFEQQITGADKAIAINKNDQELTDAISKAVVELEQEGKLQELRDKWFK